MKQKINGFYIKDFITGFFSDMDGGGILLENMGLDADTIPFDVIDYLQYGYVEWNDKDGNIAKVSYTADEKQIECMGEYLGKPHSIRLDKISDDERVDMTKTEVCRLESEALGELTMRVIFEPFIGPYEF